MDMITIFFIVGPLLALAGLAAMRVLLVQPAAEVRVKRLLHNVSVIASTWAIMIGFSLLLSAIDMGVHLLATQIHH